MDVYEQINSVAFASFDEAHIQNILYDSRNGINSIINLQHPGEHSACGFGLEPGGFSYIPQDFMDNNSKSDITDNFQNIWRNCLMLFNVISSINKFGAVKFHHEPNFLTICTKILQLKIGHVGNKTGY